MNIKLGFLLMLVGMVTVFVILLIVIYGSRLLVKLLNRITKEEQSPVKAPTGAVADDTRRVLEAAVSQLTTGKGRIMKITEI